MPAGHFVGIDAERSRATRHWNSAGKKRSSRPTKTFGLLLNWQGDVNTASGSRGSPCAQASSITACGTSWEKSASVSNGASGERPWHSFSRRRASPWPVFAHARPARYVNRISEAYFAR
jgi:hypothetical protein